MLLATLCALTLALLNSSALAAEVGLAEFDTVFFMVNRSGDQCNLVLKKDGTLSESRPAKLPTELKKQAPCCCKPGEQKLSDPKMSELRSYLTTLHSMPPDSSRTCMGPNADGMSLQIGSQYFRVRESTALNRFICRLCR